LHAGARTRRKIVLLAGGIGVTPLRALLEELPQAPGDVTMVYRAHDEGDVIFRHELEQLCAARGARLFYALGPRIPGRDSWLPLAAAELSDSEALRQLVPDIAQHDVYLCGADRWMDAARVAAGGAGVPAEQIHEERFTW
jgi:ferredoxin-NADP reductase